MALTLKQNDRRPWVLAVLEQPLNTPIPLAGATSINFIMRKKNTTGAPKVKAPCEIVDASAGVVRYKWLAGDTDVVGEYDCEFEILWGTETQTVPTVGYFPVSIVDDLDNP